MPATGGEKICLSRGDGGLLASLADLYRAGRDCDACLVCAGDGSRPVLCHRAVLAAACPTLLADGLAASAAAGEGVSTVVLPDHSHRDVRNFVDGVYGCLEDRRLRPGDLAGLQSVFESLVPEGSESSAAWRDLDPLEVVVTETEQEASPKEDGCRVKIEVDEDDLDNDSWESYQEPKKAKKPKKKSKQSYEDFAKSRIRESEAKKPKGKAKTKIRWPFGIKPQKKSNDPLKNMLSKKVDPAKLESDPLNLKLRHDLEALEAMMKSAQGELVLALPREPGSLTNQLYQKPIFASILGVQVANDGWLEAKPLMWSPADPSELIEYRRQFSNFAGAMKAVFGLSEVEAYAQQAVRTKMGVLKGSGQTRGHPNWNRALSTKISYYQSSFSRKTQEELQAVVDNEEVAAANRMGQPKPPFGPSRLVALEENTVVRLVCNMDPEDMEGILFTFYKSNEELLATWVQVQDPRVEDLVRVYTGACDIWLLRAPAGQRLPLDQAFLNDLGRLLPLKEKYEVARDLLLGGGRPKVPLAEISCPDCQMVFPYHSTQDRNNFRMHKQKHFYQDFKCNCEKTWGETFQAWKSHIRMIHMEGWVKCPHCDFTERPGGLDSHLRNAHAEYTCEHCGKFFKGYERFSEHLRLTHPEHCPKEVLKRKRKELQSDKSGFCRRCQAHFPHWRSHNREVHQTSTSVCHLCGKSFSRPSGLAKHMAYAHTANEDRPLPCPKCPKRFALPKDLSAHVKTAHDPTHRLACRYPGCDMAYPSSGSRDKHETLKHGMTYNQAASAGLVPSLPGLKPARGAARMANLGVKVSAPKLKSDD